MQKSFEVRPLSESLPFGAEILGLNPKSLSDPDVRKALLQEWIQKGVLVFRGLDGGEQIHTELSGVFGRLIGHPVQTPDPNRRNIFTVRHDPQDAYLTEVDGKVLSAWLPWHSDLVHVDSINHGGVLRPLVIPSQGGETGFLDKIATYDAMPQRLKQKIENLYVLYQFDRNPSHMKFGGPPAKIRVLRENTAALEWLDRKFPLVLHPMVYTQVETGRKMLNVSPWHALGIHKMKTAEGDALLKEVVQYATDVRFAYFHPWKMGDMVLWDNWRVLHSCTGCSPTEERWMERTTIEGDYGMGRLAANEVIDDSMRVEV